MKREGPLAAVLLLALASCRPLPDLDFRQEMRDFVQELSAYAEVQRPGFIVIPQNGHDLVTTNGEHDGPLAAAYLDAIDGLGQEDLRYGYSSDDTATPQASQDWMLGFLDAARGEGKTILVTDYCSTPANMVSAYNANQYDGFVSFGAPRRELDVIPAYSPNPPTNDGAIAILSDTRNFLYLLNPTSWTSHGDFVAALDATNYDLFIVDAFYDETTMLGTADTAALGTKPAGADRPVVAYMSIGEAEDYRYYWQAVWSSVAGRPDWLDRENPAWPGNYKVRYWEPEWQAIIYGSPDAYLDRIIAAGFDGVYLDIIEAFEYFE